LCRYPGTPYVQCLCLCVCVCGPKMESADPDAIKWGDWQRLTPFEQLMVDDAAGLNSFAVSALFFFHGGNPVTLEWARTQFAPRLLAHPRFRARLQVSRSGRASFVPLPTPLDLTDLVVEEQPQTILPSAAGLSGAAGADACASELAARDEAFYKRIDTLVTAPLPRDRPLWAMHLLPGYVPDAPGRQGTTLLLRVHHVIADGVGMVKFCAVHVADKRPDEDLQTMLPVPHRQRSKNDCKSDIGATNGGALSDGDAGCRPADGGDADGGINSGRGSSCPRSERIDSGPTGKIIRCLRIGRDFLSIFFGTGIPDPRSVFNTLPVSSASAERQAFLRYIPSSLFPFRTIRAASKRLRVSINDLFCTAIAGAIREYLLRFGGDDHRFPGRLRVGFTINNHDLSSTNCELSNTVVVVPFRIPVHTGDRQGRLNQVHDLSQRVKTGKKPEFASIALHLLSLFPRVIRAPIFSSFAYSVSGFSSNVPGPPCLISVGGVQVDSIAVSAAVDHRGGGVAFTLFTYGSNCSLCVSGDSRRILYPKELVEIFIQEMIAVCKLAEERPNAEALEHSVMCN
jgi:diacylglycerol O-acyltransferase / wax synthase